MAISNTPSPLSNLIAAKTYNAAWFSGSTIEAQISAAIAAAVLDGALYVYVPANMLPYNAANVTFNAAIKMLREGGDSSAFDIKAYGAVGDGVANDSAAVQAALNAAIANGGGEVFFPHGTYKLTTGITYTVSVDTSANITFRGAGTRAELSASTGIDLLTIKCTNVAFNIRRVNFVNLGFRVNHASARGLVLEGASYCQGTNLDFSGSGAGLICGESISSQNLSNQFSNVRITQPGTGLQIKGNYNQFSNLQVAESITGAFAISVSGTGNSINGFFCRGAGGTGGTATVIVNSDADSTLLSNGYILDSYAVGLHCGGGRHTKVTGVTIVNSQTHGLQVSGGLQGTYLVTCQNNGLATAETYNHINVINGATDNTFIAQFVGTAALNDYSANSTATRNTLIPGTLPNGVSLPSTTTWRPNNWCVGRNTTANRPTLTANDIGVSFLDSTLAANGKAIWWTGTIWVDATGASV